MYVYMQNNGGFGRTLDETIIDTGQTPVEQSERASLPPETRWKMYRNQSGRSFDYFLTETEYKHYLNQFPFIREKRPRIYENAIKARDDYEKVKGFFPYYWKLSSAAKDAQLTLETGCTLGISFRKESFLNLLLEETVNAIRDNIVEKVLSLKVLEKVAKFLNIVAPILMFAQLWDCERRKELVKEQEGSKRAQAFRRKLSFAMDVMAQELKKKKPGIDWKGWLIQQYDRFEPIFLNYTEHTSIEQSLDPNVRKQPAYLPARQYQ